MTHLAASSHRGPRRLDSVGLLVCALCLTVGAATANAAPPAEKIIADAVAAMGGPDAVAKIDTLYTKSTITVGMNVITLDSYWAKSGERLLKQSMEGRSMTTGYDGTVGWMVTPAGVMPLGEDRVAQLDDQASLHMRLLTMDKTADEQFSSVRSMEPATFAGRECNRLHVVTTDAAPEEGHVFFDAKTGLPAGWEMTSAGPQGPETASMTLSEWKEKNGILFFHKMEVGGAGQPMIIRVKELAINSTGKEVFRAPPEAARFAKAKDEGGGAKKKLEDFSPEQRAQIEQMLRGFGRITDPAQLEGAAKAMESSAGFMPADQREVVEYVLERARERIRKLRGG